MSLRLRHHLLFFLLFAGFGAANSVLYYSIIRSELQWSMQEEGKARVLSAASLLKNELVGLDSSVPSEIEAALRRFSKNAGGLTLVLFRPDQQGWTARPLLTEPELPMPEAPNRDLLGKAAGESAWTRRLSQDDKEYDLCLAYAALEDSEGRTIAVIGLSSRESQIRVGLNQVIKQCLFASLALIVLGLFVAEILTRIVLGGLRRLEAGAEALARAEYGHPWTMGRISEINDLVNTFDTIAQILEEGVRKSWRRLFQAELKPGEQETAKDLRQSLDDERKKRKQAPALALRRLGPCPSALFWGLDTGDDGWTLVAGRRCQDKDSLVHDPLAAELAAAAAGDYLLAELKKSDCHHAGSKLRERLGFEIRCILKSPAGADHLLFSSADADWAERRLPRDKRVLVGTLEEHSMNLARSHLGNLAGVPLEEAATRLSGFLPASATGLLLLIEEATDGKTGE